MAVGCSPCQEDAEGAAKDVEGPAWRYEVREEVREALGEVREDVRVRSGHRSSTASQFFVSLQHFWFQEVKST